MNSIRIFLQKEYRILCVILISIVIAIISASLMGDNVGEVRKDYVNALGESIVQKTYTGDEMQPINYLVNNDNYTSQNNDPQLIVHGVNTYVSSLNIVFGKPIAQDIFVQIYWGIEGEGFVPERAIGTTAYAGSQNLKVNIGAKVTDLRLDIGTEDNVTFSLSYVILNPDTLTGRLLQCIRENMHQKIWIDRFQIIFILTVFVLLHFVVNIQKMYNVLFNKRWLVAGILLIFLVANKYHGDSIACFDSYIQPGDGSEYVLPIIGKERSIRSDEWLTSTPTELSEQYLKNPYGKYNNLIRATDTVNSDAFTIMSVLNPINLIRMLIKSTLGYDYAHSFKWYSRIFLTFLFQLELFLIMSSQRKLLSLCGTCMVVLSSHYLWWNFPEIILYSSVALVCAYYFFHSKTRVMQILYAYGTAVGTAQFIMILYPAWEVPMGFFSIAVFVWIVHECWDDIKKMSKVDWGILFSALLLCIIMILSSMISSKDYMEAISTTVYPGSRVEYGGFSIPKLFNYVGAALFAYKDYGNPSESGMYITLFPFPIIAALYVWIKGNKKNWLLNGLIIVSVFLGFYTTTGFPHLLARITFMTYSTPNRCVDILGYVQVILFVVALSDLKSDEKITKNYALIFATIMSGTAIIIANHYMQNYMNRTYMIISFGVLLFIFFSCIAKVKEKIYNLGLIMIILISLVTGIYVRPICKGLDAIYSKSVAKEIQKIVEKDNTAKWIAYNTHVLPQFALACGAPVINSINRYPNMELWRKLDPTGVNDYFYNRYAHFIITFTENETNMELLQDDLMRLNLSFRDIEKTGVKYIFSLQPLTGDNQYVAFNEIYNERGSYIYEVTYN